jgi:glycine/D-amino acid oxidase-like deaminating enzyme
MTTTADAVIIGGGFYGAALATYLRKARGLSIVILYEREPILLGRASYHNQARIHNGYHYPRSFQTAYRSRVNLPRFTADFPDSVYDNFTHLYAIARVNSKVNAAQFIRFCREIGARLEPASAVESGLFDKRLIERVFRVEEMAFNALALRTWAARELDMCGVRVACGMEVVDVRADENHSMVAVRSVGGAESERVRARYVFNCTYSGLQAFAGGFAGCTTPLKHEIAELAVVRVPEPLRHLGITVMDGPFFSLTPFPARNLHTLSHVRYTPHFALSATEQRSPYACLADYAKQTRFDRMKRDASRYMPILNNLRYENSLFEVKTVLVKNELDDGRPILFERHAAIPGCYSILGGKLDNIYDIYARLDAETFRPLGEMVTR